MTLTIVAVAVTIVVLALIVIAVRSTRKPQPTEREHYEELRDERRKKEFEYDLNHPPDVSDIADELNRLRERLRKQK